MLCQIIGCRLCEGSVVRPTKWRESAEEVLNCFPIRNERGFIDIASAQFKKWMLVHKDDLIPQGHVKEMYNAVEFKKKICDSLSHYQGKFFLRDSRGCWKNKPNSFVSDMQPFQKDANQPPTISLEKPKDISEIVQREVTKRVPAEKLQKLANKTLKFLAELNSEKDPLQCYASIFIYSTKLEKYGLLDMMKTIT